MLRGHNTFPKKFPPVGKSRAKGNIFFATFTVSNYKQIHRSYVSPGNLKMSVTFQKKNKMPKGCKSRRKWWPVRPGLRAQAVLPSGGH